MQRLLYSILSLLAGLALLVFALPVFLVFAALVLLFILIGMLTGRTTFTVYRGRTAPPPEEPSRPRVDKGVIDITDDQEKK